jgi:hypothetical protein
LYTLVAGHRRADDKCNGDIREGTRTTANEISNKMTGIYV